MEYNRAQLKRDVKLSMKGATSRPMLVTLLFTVMVSVGTWLINTVLGWLLTGGVSGISETALHYLEQGYEVKEAVYITMLELFRMGPGAIFGAVVGGTVLSILVALWQSVMNVGYEGYCLSLVRNEDPPMGKVFGALPQFVPVLVTRFLTGLFILLWTLLVGVGYVAMIAAAGVVAALTESVVLIIILVLAAVVYLTLGIVWVSMRYVLVDYVLLDKSLSGMDAIRENKRLMKGNIGRAFLLQMSFIGWYLLMIAIVYAGIMLAVIPLIYQISASSTGGLIAASGFALVIILAVVIAATVLELWLKPYVTGTMARFYDWTQGRADGFGSGFSGGSEGWGEHTGYTWTAGPTSGTGTGNGPAFGGGSGSDNGVPRSPKPPRDDPWN